jgi:hypothetical protein
MSNQTISETKDNTTVKEPLKVELVEKAKEKPKVWNSLERTKIFVGLLTPIAILMITLSINKSINENNLKVEHDKRIYQQRQEIYSKIGPLLNDIYSYNMYVGLWKQLSPQDIINHKRELDKIIYTNIPYFDTASVFLNCYNDFMKETFKTGRGWGKDAALRTDMILHKRAIDKTFVKWIDKWNENFTNEDNRENVKRTYFALLRQVSTELDLKIKGTDIDKTIDLKTIDTIK